MLNLVAALKGFKEQIWGLCWLLSLLVQVLVLCHHLCGAGLLSFHRFVSRDIMLFVISRAYILLEILGFGANNNTDELIQWELGCLVPLCGCLEAK